MELRTARGRLFLLIALIVSLPILNYKFKFIESGKLDGVSPKAELKPFSLKSWWDGDYQQQRNTLMNDSIGFRPDLVRMNNQLDYWLFSKINAGTIILGSDDYLFGKMYIDEYNGVGYMGDSTVAKVCVKIKKIQDTMDKLGKTFILVYTPSKAYYFSEKIPAYLRRTGTPKTNYYSFRHYGDSMSIRQLDYNALFLKMKDTAKYPLISRQGIHWSLYGAALAVDTLERFIERERHITMPHVNFDHVDVSDVPRGSDADLATILNLIRPITKEQLAYPELVFEDSTGKTKPRTIYIGDSFLWLWTGNSVLERTNSNWQFWPHFDEVWTIGTITGEKEIVHMKDYNWKKSLDDADCIMLMFNPINLGGFTLQSHFVEDVYKYYYPAG